MTGSGDPAPLAEFLRQLCKRQHLVKASRLLPAEPTRLRRQVSELEVTFGMADIGCPPDNDLERVRGLLLAAWRRRLSLSTLPPRSLRVAPWVLWASDFAPAADPDFLSHFVAAGERLAIAQFVRALAHTFLLFYPRDLPTFEQWRKAVLNLVIRYAPRQRRLFEAWHKWQKYNILSNEGPKLMARTFAREGNPREILAQAGLEYGLENSKFLEETLKIALVELQIALGARDFRTSRLTMLLILAEDGHLRFPSLKAQIAHALLLPFRERDPQEELRQRLTEFLKGLFGDPRLQRHQWHGISDQDQAVMRRWLARVTLEDFFRVIDATADPSHWQDRKAFWTRYWEQGFISDAWVALGWTTRSRLSGDAIGGYATLDGALHNHAALLLRIGQALVLEWSHSGACRIYPHDVTRCPKLYQSRYSATELRVDTELWVAHRGQRWREKIAEHLSQVGGVPNLVSPAAPPVLGYRPKGRWW